VSGAASRNRGKTTEQMGVRWLRGNGFDGAERVVRTGWRTADHQLPDGGDVLWCPGIISQFKALRPVNRMERAVPRWMAETEAQRVAAGAAVGLLVVRRDGTADVGEWWAFLPLHMLHNLAWPEHLHPWTKSDHRPARLLVSDTARLLRAAGYGTPLAEALDRPEARITITPLGGTA
jgi:hypothetical protein